jgi:hypothetical protein
MSLLMGLPMGTTVPSGSTLERTHARALSCDLAASSSQAYLVLRGVGEVGAETLGRQTACRQVLDVLGVLELVHLAQDDLREQHHAHAATKS